LVLFPTETQSIKDHIINDEFIQAKTAIDDVVQKAFDFGFGVDGFLIGELLHLKVHVNSWLGIFTTNTGKEKPDLIKSKQQSDKDQCLRTIEVIRNIQ